MARVTALLLSATSVSATSYTWRGIIDNQWTTPNNWQPATSASGPGDSPSDVVTIDDNEGKNAVVELTAPGKKIQLMNMGDKLGIKATLRLLQQLTVSQELNVQPNGVLQLNSGNAQLSAGKVNCMGKFEFYSGYVTSSSGVDIKAPGLADFGSATYQGAKQFDNVNVAVTTSALMKMGGSLQFGSNAAITSSVGIVGAGSNFQFVLINASTGTGNSITSPGFNWTQS